MKKTRTARWSAVMLAAVLVTGCSSGGDDSASEANDGGTQPAGSEAEAEEEPAHETMPDVVGLPVDEAVAQLEEAGFVVSTGIVRTTEMEPDLIYRSEPAPGRQITPGQRVTLRVAGEPRE